MRQTLQLKSKCLWAVQYFVYIICNIDNKCNAVIRVDKVGQKMLGKDQCGRCVVRYPYTTHRLFYDELARYHPFLILIRIQNSAGTAQYSETCEIKYFLMPNIEFLES